MVKEVIKISISPSLIIIITIGLEVRIITLNKKATTRDPPFPFSYPTPLYIMSFILSRGRIGVLRSPSRFSLCSAFDEREGTPPRYWSY